VCVHVRVLGRVRAYVTYVHQSLCLVDGGGDGDGDGGGECARDADIQFHM